jgi:hypothetical protein
MSSILTSLPYYISYNDLVNNATKSSEWQTKWDIDDDEWDEIIGVVIARGETAYVPPEPKKWKAKMDANEQVRRALAAISSSYQSKASPPPPSQIVPGGGKGLMRPLAARTSSSSSSAVISRQHLTDPFDFGDGRERDGSGLSPPRRDRERSRERPDMSSAADIQKATIDHVYKLGFEAGKIAASKEECPACALRRQRNRGGGAQAEG